jgi:glycosyltransferase 2 family protein
MTKNNKPLKVQEELENLTDEQRNVLRSLRSSRMILPILLGLSVVGYMFWRNFDAKMLQKISWTRATFLWIFAAVVLIVLRHLAMSARMWIISQGHFTYRKCIELVLIFEFSLSITPTTLGGSAVSLFVLTQEKLSAARTTTIVLYKVVLDTLFFVGTFPILYLISGAKIVAPDMTSLLHPTVEARIFYFTYTIMSTYGLFLFYGLFINPSLIKKFLTSVTSLPLLKRFKPGAARIGSEIVLAAEELRNIGWRQHALAFLCTWLAWTFKFFLISCLVVGIYRPEMSIDREILLYSRLQAMFIIMALSPSPGGAGIAEGLFPKLMRDFIPEASIATVVALIWRLISYYPYLVAGAVVVPNWVRRVFLKNLREKNKLAIADDKI